MFHIKSLLYWEREGLIHLRHWKAFNMKYLQEELSFIDDNPTAIEKSNESVSVLVLNRESISAEW